MFIKLLSLKCVSISVHTMITVDVFIVNAVSTLEYNNDIFFLYKIPLNLSSYSHNSGGCKSAKKTSSYCYTCWS